jgi:hypothetical protein
MLLTPANDLTTVIRAIREKKMDGLRLLWSLPEGKAIRFIGGQLTARITISIR